MFVSKDYFESDIATLSEFSMTYEAFLNIFIDLVESFYGDASIWEGLFTDVEVYAPGIDCPKHTSTWVEKGDAKISDFKLRFQCATLAELGRCKRIELGDHGYYPYGERWRKCEIRTAGVLAECKGSKELIAAVFIYAVLASKRNRSEVRDERFFLLSEHSHSRMFEAKLGTSRCYESKRLSTRDLKNALRSHLNDCNISSKWATTCTSLLPIVNDQLVEPQYFTDYYDLSSYLAQRFILLNCKVAVAIVSTVSKEDPAMTARVQELIEINRAQRLSVGVKGKYK